jgi:hypothetical protein
LLQIYSLTKIFYDPLKSGIFLYDKHPGRQASWATIILGNNHPGVTLDIYGKLRGIAPSIADRLAAM